MFGPAFLVAPVTTYQARSRNVYLPATTGDWYDFWTGTSTAGGQTIDARGALRLDAAVRPGRVDHSVRSRTCNTPARNRPTRSRCTFTPVRMARSRSTKTTV